MSEALLSADAMCCGQEVLLIDQRGSTIMVPAFSFANESQARHPRPHSNRIMAASAGMSLSPDISVAAARALYKNHYSLFHQTSPHLLVNCNLLLGTSCYNNRSY